MNITELKEVGEYFILKANNYEELVEEIYKVYDLDESYREYVEELLTQLDNYKGTFIVYGNEDYPICDCVIKKYF